MRFGVKMLAIEEQFLIRTGDTYMLKMNLQNTQNKILLNKKTLKNFGSLVIRECMHFFRDFLIFSGGLDYGEED